MRQSSGYKYNCEQWCRSILFFSSSSSSTAAVPLSPFPFPPFHLCLCLSVSLSLCLCLCLCLPERLTISPQPENPGQKPVRNKVETYRSCLVCVSACLRAPLCQICPIYKNCFHSVHWILIFFYSFQVSVWHQICALLGKFFILR